MMRPAQKPTLREPIFMAAWPGMGLVAHRAVSHLIDKLEASPLATIPPEDRFALGAVSVKEGLVDDIQLPEGKFFSKKGGERDLLFFLGDEQPVAGKEWSIAHEILEVAESFGARQLFTFAAMPRRIDHHQTPGVWGVATDRDLLERLRKHDIQILDDGSISGLNGVLLGVAKKRGWTGFCLLGEIPLYATQMENPRGSQAILEKVSAMTGIAVDLEALRILGDATSAQLDLIFQEIRQRNQTDATEEEDEDDSGGEPMLN